MANFEGPYRDARLGEFGFSAPYDARPPSTPWTTRLKRLALGRPFRRQQLNESAGEYRLAQFAHFYEQRRRVLGAVLFVLLLNLAVYWAYTISTGRAGVELGRPPPSPYCDETTAARRALHWDMPLPVYLLPCTTWPVGIPLEPSALVDVETVTSNPRHPDVAEVTLFENAARMLFDRRSIAELPCICGPLLGYAQRVVMFRSSSAKSRVSTLYNPTIVNKSLNEQRVVRHSQAAWFDVVGASTFIDHTSDVELIRPFAVTVRGSDGRSHELIDSSAYCVQECMDLLDARSIWDVAVEQAREGHELNAEFLPQLRQRFRCLWNE